MSVVRFAMLCDKCGNRSEEYGVWPHCRVCGEHICSACDVDAERSDDEQNRTLCRDCAVLEIEIVYLPRSEWPKEILDQFKEHRP